MSQTKRSKRSAAAAWAALIAVLSMPATGAPDWLVLRDGARVETRGAVRLEGRRVLFTQANGSLAALPADEVDLAATEAANRPPAPPPAAPVEAAPVRRFTDADFAHVDDVETPTIAFYTTSWCGWCRKSRELLDRLGARYHEQDVEQSAAAAREKERLAPGSGVPVIAFRETVIPGYSERGIQQLVDAWRAAEQAAAAAREASRRPARARHAAD
jgi:glutaredoxin